MKYLKSLILAAAVTVVSGGVAQATPLVNYQILGNTDGSSNYTSSLTVTPGQTVFYELVGSMAPVGTSNGSKTISSLTPGTDGIIADSLNLVDTVPANMAVTFTAATLVTAAKGPSNSGGTPGTNSLNSIKAATDTIDGFPPFGVTAANTGGYQQLLTGSFVIGQGATGATTIGEAFPSGTTGSFKINGGTTSILLSSTATDTTNQAYAPLSLNVANTPEPATLSLLLGAATLGLLSRRQRKA